MTSRCVALVIALALAACHRGEESGPPPAPAPTSLQPEEVATVERGTLASGPTISGTLEASRAATVNARLGGTVERIGPELGEAVKRGALLVKIDPGPLGAATVSARAQVDSAATSLELAEREVERTRALVKGGALARRDLERAQSAVEAQRAAVRQARAQLASASEQLGEATVRAPIDGVVGRRAVGVGDVVAVGSPLYELVDPSSMRLSASVPSDQIAALRVGAPVQFQVRGFDRTFEGSITRIAPAADPQTRQIPILVDIPNSSGTLLSGLFAEGRVEARTEAGVVVPSSAIAEDGTASVLRVVNGTVERVPVTLGLRDTLNDRILVTKGLAPGDRIVVRASAAPPPGTPVTIASR